MSYLARAILVVFLLWAATTSAVVLDWSTVTWSAGSLTQTYDLDADGKNDVTVAFSGNTSALTSGSPAISSGLTANVDFSTTSQAITVTVTFLNTLATDVSLTLYNIDADRKGSSSNFAFQDVVNNISGTTKTGTAIPTVTVGSLVTYSGGTAIGQDVAGYSSAGNVNMVYTNEISSFQFTFGSSDNIAGNNPDPQEFAISSITYRKVPEVGVIPAALLLCFVTVFLRRRALSRAA